MKRRSVTLIVLLSLFALLANCGAARYIPEGSQSLGVFEGSFNGKLHDGFVRIELFQTSQGSKLFEGNFKGGDVQLVAFVHGTMTVNTLEGPFEEPYDGTLNGQLSSDGGQLSGSFEFESPEVQSDSGTWKAVKK